MENSKKIKRVLIFGTFDFLHPGHISFFKQARAITDSSYLVASIARDSNVTRIKRHAPVNSESNRLELVSSCRLIDEAVLSAQDDYIGHIVSLAPDYVALGYDQIAYTEGLEQKLSEAGLNCKIVRLQPFHPETYKTAKLKRDSLSSL